LKFSLKPVF